MWESAIQAFISILVLRLPLRFTLFPYTTLFRSVYFLVWSEQELALCQSVFRSFDRLGAPVQTKDRKSTRLNSSHSQISYAVFCLKKKRTTSLASRYARPPAIRRSRLTSPAIRSK